MRASNSPGIPQHAPRIFDWTGQPKKMGRIIVNGVNMRHLKRTILAAFTWLTAVATLLAGLPQERCLCAVAQGKVALRDAAEAAPRPCCSRHGRLADPDPPMSSESVETASVSTQTWHACCCGRHSKPAGEPFGHSRLARAKCLRGYVQTNQQATDSSQTKADNQGSLAVSLPSGPAISAVAGVPTDFASVGHSLSPPVDLVRLLKRLLI